MSESPESQPTIVFGPRYVLPPWRVALYGSVPALVFAILYGVFPLFEVVWLPFLPNVSSAYFVGAFAGLCLLWGLAALIRRKRDGHTAEAIVGVALSFVAAAITVVGALGYANN